MRTYLAGRLIIWLSAFAMISLLISLAGCAGTAQTRAKTSLASVCKSHEALVKQLTPMKAAGQLSAVTIKRIDDSIVMIRPICGSGSTFDPALGVAVVQQAMRIINGGPDGNN